MLKVKIKKAYKILLSKPPVSGVVFFTGGGTGAGKSSGIKNVKHINKISESSDVIYDTNMNKYDSAVKKIDQAINSNRKVHINYVLRDPVESFTQGMIPRMKRMGRSVPLDSHVSTHIGAIETAKKLKDKYKDSEEVSISLINNDLGKGNARVESFDYLESFSTFDKQTLYDKLLNITKELYANREITEKQFKGIVGEREFNSRSNIRKANKRKVKVFDESHSEGAWDLYTKSVFGKSKFLEKSIKVLSTAFDKGMLSEELYLSVLEKAKKQGLIKVKVNVKGKSGKTYQSYRWKKINNEKIDIKQIKQDAEKIIKGEKRIKRLSPEEEEGRIKGGRKNVEATLVLRGNEISDSTEPQRIAELIEKQEDILTDYAKNNNAWFEYAKNFYLLALEADPDDEYSKDAVVKMDSLIIEKKQNVKEQRDQVIAALAHADDAEGDKPEENRADKGEAKDVQATKLPESEFYSVQLGAFNDWYDESAFTEVPDMLVAKGSDYKRVLSGRFNDREKAIDRMNQLKESGFPECFVVTMSGEERVGF